MRIPAHPNRKRVPAQVVRAVLDNARAYSIDQWAAHFRVHPQTIKTWKAMGMTLDLWSGPSRKQWNTVAVEARDCLSQILDGINGSL